MRSFVVLTEDAVVRLGAGVTGVVFIAGAALAADLARQHMAAIETLCGAAADPHCSWCYGAAGLAVAGLVAFAAAIPPGLLATARKGPQWTG